jgi:selenocysteine lyase/cysteine desulfurase
VSGTGEGCATPPTSYWRSGCPLIAPTPVTGITGRLRHAEFEGIRVTPCVYTTTDEVDLFAEEMEKVIAKGLPA